MGFDQHEKQPKCSFPCRFLKRTLAMHVVAVGLAILVGCRGSNKSEGASETEKRLQELHGWMTQYIMEARAPEGQRPNSSSRPNPEGFKEFVTTLPPHRIGDTEGQKLLVSPRDGEPFVINANLPYSGHIPAIWEKTGVNGNRYVVFADGNVEEVDEETFTRITQKK